MKHLLFCMLLFVFFFISCKKDSNSIENNFIQQVFLPDSIHAYDHTGNYNLNADSTLYSRSIFSYDQKGNVTRRVNFNLSPFLKQWSGSKNEYEFNDSGSEVMNATYGYSNNKQWIINKKSLNTYDQKNRLIQKESLTFDNDGTINSGSKSEYTLNAIGIVTNEGLFSWDKLQNNWIISGKVEYITDNSGFQVSYNGFKWNKSAEMWVLSSKGKLETDLKGNIIQRVDRSLYDGSETWHVDSILYKYDGNGREISYELYLDGVNGNYFSKDKIDHNYYANGNLFTRTIYYWNYGFIPLTFYEYVYNSDGNLSSILLYSSYKHNSIQPYDRTDYLYNSEGKLTYGANYLVDSSKKKIKSIMYFSSKHNKLSSEINANDILGW